MHQEISGRLDGSGKNVAVVVSRFNELITDRLLKGALDTLLRCGVGSDAVTVVRVPGSFEIPLAAQTLAASGRYQAVVCLGALIRGETAHFDYIAAEVTRGIGQAALESGVPVAYGVLTADSSEQALDRSGLKKGNKGSEAAAAALEMADLLRRLRT